SVLAVVGVDEAAVADRGYILVLRAAALDLAQVRLLPDDPVARGGVAHDVALVVLGRARVVGERLVPHLEDAVGLVVQHDRAAVGVGDPVLPGFFAVQHGVAAVLGRLVPNARAVRAARD